MQLVLGDSASPSKEASEVEGFFNSGIGLVGGRIFPFESSRGEDCGSGIMGGCYGYIKNI